MALWPTLGRTTSTSPKCCSDTVLQPPLSRRGTGPGIIIFLPRLSPSCSFRPERCQISGSRSYNQVGFLLLSQSLALVWWSSIGSSGFERGTGSPSTPWTGRYQGEVCSGNRWVSQADVSLKFPLVFFIHKSTIRKLCALSQRLFLMNL